MILINLNFFRGAPNQMAIVHDTVLPQGACHKDSAHVKLASEERKQIRQKEKMMIKIQFLFCQNLNEVRLSATAKTFLELTRLGPVRKSGSNSSRSSRVWNSIISILQGLGGTPLGLCHVQSTDISIRVERIHSELLLDHLIFCLRLALRVLGWGKQNTKELAIKDR